MKRPALIVLAILILALLSTYFIIPQNIVISKSVGVDATDMNVAKFLVNKRPWQKWWPGAYKQGDSSIYNYKNFSITLGHNTNSDMPMMIYAANRKISGQLTYLATSELSTNVTWNIEMQSSINPFSRIFDYFCLRSLSNKLGDILVKFKAFMEDDTNIYGTKLRIDKVEHPTVLATTIRSDEYPSPAVVYHQLSSLRQQLKAGNALQVDSPMMNVHPVDKAYEIMVAIPIDRIIKPGKNTVINKLVLNANLLTTEVKGGPNTILNTFEQLKKYQKDHHLTSPAMPFEVLLTNRQREPDTAKWVTKVQWPIY